MNHHSSVGDSEVLLICANVYEILLPMHFLGVSKSMLMNLSVCIHQLMHSFKWRDLSDQGKEMRTASQGKLPHSSQCWENKYLGLHTGPKQISLVTYVETACPRRSCKSHAAEISKVWLEYPSSLEHGKLEQTKGKSRTKQLGLKRQNQVEVFH